MLPTARSWSASLATVVARRRRTAAAAGQAQQREPAASDVLYVEALAAPDTINTIPEETLCAPFAEHGHATRTLPADGGD